MGWGGETCLQEEDVICVCFEARLRDVKTQPAAPSRNTSTIFSQKLLSCEIMTPKYAQLGIDNSLCLLKLLASYQPLIFNIPIVWPSGKDLRLITDDLLCRQLGKSSEE